MHSLFQDLRYCARQLLRSPGFTVTAITSLALGIGAATAVFSIIYAALINPYPFRDASGILRLSARTKSGGIETLDLNTIQIQELRQLPIIQSVLAMDYHAMTMTNQGLPENVNVIGLISTGFDDLGVPPAMGRGFIPSDGPVDGHSDPQAVALVSYKFWQERLGSDPQAVGKRIQLDNQTYSIIGVAGSRFRWYNADVYLPLKMAPDPDHVCLIDFRLRPGVTAAAANAALQPLVDQFAKAMPKRFPEQLSMQVEDLNAWVSRSMSGTLYLLFGAVILLLTIGCGNVSILLMAQGTARQQEFAIRAAAGAQSRRIIRQLLTESLLLAFLGVAFGVFASYGILAAMKTVLPQYAFAPEVVIRINLPVLLFSAGIAVVTALLFGLWPALELSKTQVAQIIVSTTRRAAGSVRGRRTHNALITAQIGLTLVLLAGAGAAMKGFLRLIHTPLGYDPHSVMSVGIPLRENTYTTWAARAAYFEQLRSRVAGTSGVAMAAISSNATPPRNGWRQRFEILGKPAAAAEQQTASVNMVSPEYFAVLREPLLEGRVWDTQESQRGSHVAVVNKTFARQYFPNGGGIGQSVKIPGIEARPPAALSPAGIADSWLQICGIVDDAKNDGLARPIQPAIFVPFTLDMRMGTQILVRTEAPPLTLLRAVRLQLTAVDPNQQSYNTTGDLETWISDEPEWQQEHLAAWIFGVFSSLALILAAVGLYSVVSYTVAQRTGEFGIRMALGAKRADIVRVVVGSMLGSVGAGILIGLLLSLALNTTVSQWAKEDARDPLILLAGALLMTLAAGIASTLPAWQASRTDPMTALRSQ